MTRMDLLSPRARKDGKTFWLKIGAAFPLDKGGYQLLFDALPLADAEGRVTLIMKEPSERGEKPAYNQSPQEQYTDASKGGGGFPDDDIPFSMEWR